MINALKKLFDTSNNSTTLDDIKREEEERLEKERLEEEKRLEEERKKDRVKLDCVGNYRFEVKKNPETQEEYRARRGISNQYWDGYDSHFVIVLFDVTVTYNNIDYKLDGKFIQESVAEEDYAYQYIFNLLKKGDSDMEKLQRKLKHEIVLTLDNHLKNDNVEEMKKILKESNSFDINFTIETYKTRNM